jgi:hypothetical protein
MPDQQQVEAGSTSKGVLARVRAIGRYTARMHLPSHLLECGLTHQSMALERQRTRNPFRMGGKVDERQAR